MDPDQHSNPDQPLAAQIEDLLASMTLEEKVSLCHGDSLFTVAAVERLGIPPLHLSDGPHGVREEVSSNSWQPAGWTDDYSTYLPTETALAATWNPNLARKFGEVLGREAKARGKDIILGPGINIHRTPLCGRNFEYLSEDPYLISCMVVPLIQGIQAQKVAACVKHFVANNQEYQRHCINVEMDERALREIYLPGFEAAVRQAGALTVMGAYNQFRGQHCCHNDFLLNMVLRQEWGFEGAVISDWNGTHDTWEAAHHGLDLEMGTERPFDKYYLATPFLEAIQKGEIAESVVDDKVRRLLWVMFQVEKFGPSSAGARNTPEHQQVTRKVAQEAIVLLKNEGQLLPLNLDQISSIAVIGANATRKQARGGGSSTIKALYEVTPLEGIIKQVAGRANVIYAQGYSDSDKVDDDLLPAAVQAAGSAEVAIIIGGLNHESGNDAEAVDRPDMQLPYGQDELIQAVVAANPRTIVVLVSGSPVEMTSWLSSTPAVVQGWYAGMEAGNALADVIFGAVCPSGKLPLTFPRKLEDSPAHATNSYPGRDGTVRYEEGLLVGYRYFDTKQVEPAFCFGHGLSYTSFEYDQLALNEDRQDGREVLMVQFDLSNVGQCAGAETVQVYVRHHRPRLFRPVKELKGFDKVYLQPGESQRISIPLDRSAFSFYDDAQGGWIFEPGEFSILVGSSSRDIRLQASLQISDSRMRSYGN